MVEINVHQWRRLVNSSQGPPSAVTRHILLSLSLYMNSDGNCFPSHRTLATDTALSRRCIQDHVRLAEKLGWIKVKNADRGGQGWKRFSYEMAMPADVGNTMPHVEEKGGEAYSPPTPERGAPDSPPFAERGERHSKRGEPDDMNVGNGDSLNYKKNYPKNNSCPASKPKKSQGATKEEIPFAEIVAYLNSKTGKEFRHTSKETRRLIAARWNEGFLLNDFEAVIDNKTRQWLMDSENNKYLRPATLFGPKFEGYLNEQIKHPAMVQGEIAGRREIDTSRQFHEG